MFRQLRDELFPSPDAFDREFGVETAGRSFLLFHRVLMGKREKLVRYQPVGTEVFCTAIQLAPRHTFVDIGCGKGRALILASMAGFRDLIGVELSGRLIRVAKRNLKKLNISATILHQDATNFVFPPRPCVVFLYNPFDLELTSRIAKNLEGAYPRTVIYINPVHESAFRDFRTMHAGADYRVFSNEPA